MSDFKYEKGQKVNYHPIIDEESDGETYEILNSWKLGHGQPVYKLEGKAGCVSEDALSLAE